MTDAALVVVLANARADRRPTHARKPLLYDGLADPASASELLAPFLDRPVEPHELETLRSLQSAVVPIVDALIGESAPPLDPINSLAEQNPVATGLRAGPGRRLTVTVLPQRSTASAELLLETVRELAELDPSRLRRCARPECGLVFYDTSRSATQRWHAERPCGLRERQRRHRSRVSPGERRTS